MSKGPYILTPGTPVKMEVIQDGQDVVLVIGGASYRMPYQVGDQLKRRLHMAVKKAEEYANRESLVSDSALLLRAGVPLGLSNNPKIKDEAAKAAVNDRTLRRALPGGIKSKEQFGVPSLIITPPLQNTGEKSNG